MNEYLRKNLFKVKNDKANRLYRHWKMTKDPETLLRIRALNKELFGLLQIGVDSLKSLNREIAYDLGISLYGQDK